MSTATLDFRSLPVSERIQLVEEIWDSIADETPDLKLSPEESAELHRRLTEHQTDPSSSIPWSKCAQSCDYAVVEFVVEF